jgi:hypothetical protein
MQPTSSAISKNITPEFIQLPVIELPYSLIQIEAAIPFWCKKKCCKKYKEKGKKRCKKCPEKN